MEFRLDVNVAIIALIAFLDFVSTVEWNEIFSIDPESNKIFKIDGTIIDINFNVNRYCHESVTTLNLTNACL